MLSQMVPSNASCTRPPKSPPSESTCCIAPHKQLPCPAPHPQMCHPGVYVGKYSTKTSVSWGHRRSGLSTILHGQHHRDPLRPLNVKAGPSFFLRHTFSPTQPHGPAPSVEVELLLGKLRVDPAVCIHCTKRIRGVAAASRPFEFYTPQSRIPFTIKLPLPAQQ